MTRTATTTQRDIWSCDVTHDAAVAIAQTLAAAGIDRLAAWVQASAESEAAPRPLRQSPDDLDYCNSVVSNGKLAFVKYTVADYISMKSRADVWRNPGDRALANKIEMALFRERLAMLPNLGTVRPELLFGTRLELFLCELIWRVGMDKVIRVGRANDGGADIVFQVFQARSATMVLQAKGVKSKTRTALGEPPIRELLTGMGRHDTQNGVVVATAGFNRNAVACAARHAVQLIGLGATRGPGQAVRPASRNIIF